MNVLITGGAGFIGSNLSWALFKKGYYVTVLDNLSPQIHGTPMHFNQTLLTSSQGRLKFINGSVTSKKDLILAMSGIDVVIHLAAETGTGQSMYEIEKYTHVNIYGTSLMLDILANNSHCVKKIIVASSRAIYGEGKYFSEDYGIVYPSHRTSEYMDRGDFEVRYLDSKLPLSCLATDEESKIQPSSVYGITKQTQEQLIMTVCPTIGIEPVSLRLQNVYGPGQSLTNPYTGILSIFSTLIKNNKDITIFEDGKESRDFVYIDDVVSAIVLSIESENANGQIFNVGTGISTDIITVANELTKYFRSNTELIISGHYRLGDIRHNFADITKIKKRLNFTPTVDFQAGIKKFSDWVLSQEVPSSRLDDSILEMKAKGLFRQKDNSNS